MSIDQSRGDSLPSIQIFKPSHRTGPEQVVGLGIFLLITLGVGFATRLADPLFTTLYSVVLSFAIWTLWRRHSLRVLKLELSVFLAQFVFQIAWSASFFLLQEGLLSFVALLLLWFNTLLGALLFWKKDRLSGGLLIPAMLWVFYLVGLNYILSMRF